MAWPCAGSRKRMPPVTRFSSPTRACTGEPCAEWSTAAAAPTRCSCPRPRRGSCAWPSWMALRVRMASPSSRSRTSHSAPHRTPSSKPWPATPRAARTRAECPVSRRPGPSSASTAATRAVSCRRTARWKSRRAGSRSSRSSWPIHASSAGPTSRHAKSWVIDTCRSPG